MTHLVPPVETSPYLCRSPDVRINLNVQFTASPHGCSHDSTDLDLLQEFLICPNVLLAVGKPFAQPRIVTLKSTVLYCVCVESHVTPQNSEPKTTK